MQQDLRGYSNFSRWLLHGDIKEKLSKHTKDEFELSKYYLPISDLIEDIKLDKNWPKKSNRLGDFIHHLQTVQACNRAIETTNNAWIFYRIDKKDFWLFNRWEVAKKIIQFAGLESIYHLSPLEKDGELFDIACWEQIDELYELSYDDEQEDDPYPDIIGIGFSGKQIDKEIVYREIEYLVDINLLDRYIYEYKDTASQESTKKLEKLVQRLEKGYYTNPGWLSLRFEVLKRDNYRCQICGRTAQDDNVKLEVDHKLAKSKGGTDTLDNLWTLCFDCNRGKSAKQL